MNFTRLDSTNRTAQFELAQFPNNFVRVSDLNDVIYVLNHLNLIQDAANDGAAAALTPPVPIGGIYRNGSVLMVRVA